MSNIVESVIIEDLPQPNGQRWVVAQHVDQYGNPYSIEKFVDFYWDAYTGLINDAAELSDSLMQNEINDNITQILTMGAGAALIFNYSSESQTISAMAFRHSSLSQWETVMVSDYLNSLSDEQLNVVFGLTAEQIFVLRDCFSVTISNIDRMFGILGFIAQAYSS